MKYLLWGEQFSSFVRNLVELRSQLHQAKLHTTVVMIKDHRLEEAMKLGLAS